MAKNKEKNNDKAIAVKCFIQDYLICVYAKSASLRCNTADIPGIHYETVDFDNMSDAKDFVDSVEASKDMHTFKTNILSDRENAIYAIYPNTDEWYFNNNIAPVAYFYNDKEIDKAEYDRLYEDCLEEEI